MHTSKISLISKVNQMRVLKRERRFTQLQLDFWLKLSI